MGYLSITKEHSTDTLARILERHDAERVSRFVVSGYAQDVPSVVSTVTECSERTWIDVSWMFKGWKEPKVYRTELRSGDISAWCHVLQELDHDELSSIDDKKGKNTLDGRSVWLAMKSKDTEWQDGFQNPSYADLTGLQSIRFVDLLVTDWGWHSFGPAKFDYEPNRGTILLPQQGEENAHDLLPTGADSKAE